MLPHESKHHIYDGVGTIATLYLRGPHPLIFYEVGLKRVPNVCYTTSMGLFIDGVPILFAFGYEDTLLDIERVEVLRGPQGTLIVS